MNKQTQLYLGVAALAAAGYLLWWNQKKSENPATSTTASFAGEQINTVVGRRKRMVGMVPANKNVTDSGWVRADGSSIAPTFFDTRSSTWVRGFSGE